MAFNFKKMVKIKDFLEPMDFKNSNITFKGNGDTVKDLRAFSDGVYVVSCWHIDFKQAVRMLFKRKIWLSVQCYNIVPPAAIHTINPIEVKTKKKE